MIQPNTVQRALLRAFVFAAVSLPIVAQAAVDDVVLLWGTSTEQETMFASGPGMSTATATESDLMPSNICEKVLDFIAQNNAAETLSSMLDEIGEDVGADTDDALEECIGGEFDPDPSSGTSNVWLIYTSCSMTMGNGANIMRWTVPPLAAEAEMTILDMASNSGFTTQLETKLLEVSEETGGLAMGNLRGYDINGPNGSQQVTLRIDGQQREFQARSYDYSYRGDVAGASSGFMLVQAGRIDSDGQAWIVPDAPGTDVVSLFYQNFADHVRPSAGMGSLIDGMIKQMAGLTSHGIPVRTKQTIVVYGNSIIDGFSATGAGIKSESESTIDRIAIVPGAASQTCGATVIPEGMEITDMNDIMAGSMGAAGSGGAGNPMASPEIQEAMQQMAEQMESMTPEEKQMMEQFGLGSMLGGAATAGNSAGASANAGGSVLTQGSGSTGADSSNSGTAKLTSAELTTDNLLESVQKHLDALGYNAGNTDGTTSVMTEVAISQFQAENGMAVTGKVTPQLLGILSAKVDSR